MNSENIQWHDVVPLFYYFYNGNRVMLGPKLLSHLCHKLWMDGFHNRRRNISQTSILTCFSHYYSPQQHSRTHRKNPFIELLIAKICFTTIQPLFSTIKDTPVNN